MATTFPCPHCRATYPLKPVLVGRPVRCTQCRQAFQLGADGIALPVNATLVATSRVPTRSSATIGQRPPAAAAAKPSPALERPADPASPAAPAAPAPAAKAASTSTRRSAARSGSADDAFRKKLFAGLQEAADQAAAKAAQKAADAGDRDPGAEPTPEAARPDAGIAPAVLTGSGEREYRRRRGWIIGSVLAVAVVAAGWHLLGPSPERQALEAYVRPPAAQSGPYHGTFFGSLAQQGWLVGRALPLRDLGRVAIASARTIRVGPAGEVFTTLVGAKIYLPAHGVWVDRAAAPRIKELWNPQLDIAGNLAALRAQNIDGVDQHDVVMKCRELGLTPEDVDLLMELVLGATDANGGNLFVERFRAGQFPAALRIADFSGHGQALIDAGAGYQSVIIDYDGRLMRVDGPGWPATWQVLDLHQRDRDHPQDASGGAP
jgi:hypothetical protein